MAENIETKLEETRSRFEQIYGTQPTIVARAPGRVNLIGEHLDYNMGVVLPFAIEQDCFVAVGPSSNSSISLASVGMGQPIRLLGDEAIRRSKNPHWTDYLKGVLFGFVERGSHLPSMNVLVNSRVPRGGGLSSSAALEVSFATAMECFLNVPLSPIEKAKLCQKAEHEFAGTPCGIMDQLVSVLGKRNNFLKIDCRDNSTKDVPWSISGLSLLIANSNVQHNLGTSEYSIRLSQCREAARKLDVAFLADLELEDLESLPTSLTADESKRVRHVVQEIARVNQAIHYLQQGDIQRVGELMYQSHESLRDDYEVSCDELDFLVDSIKSLGPSYGVFGSRMTGGGFGGCTISLIKSEHQKMICDAVGSSYRERFGRDAHIISTTPAQGASLVAGG